MFNKLYFIVNQNIFINYNSKKIKKKYDSIKFHVGGKK